MIRSPDELFWKQLIGRVRRRTSLNERSMALVVLTMRQSDLGQEKKARRPSISPSRQATALGTIGRAVERCGAIPERELFNFQRWHADPVTFEGGTRLYRVHSPDKAAGHYWTTEPPASEVQWRIDAAVLPEWNNAAQQLSVLEVPEGQTLRGWAGKAASQGGWYVGGTVQVYLPDVPTEWLVTQWWKGR